MSGKNSKAAEAKKLYQSGMKLVKIAELLSVPAGTVRRWKSEQNWDGKEKANARRKPNARSQAPPEVVSVLENEDLTDKQRLFCLYYIKSFNATRSHQKAFGSAYATAQTEGWKLLQKPEIRQQLRRMKEIRYSREFFSEADVFQKFMDIAFADITDYVSFGQQEVPVMGMYGPLKEKDPETGEEIPVTRKENFISARPSEEVDGSMVTEISQGRNGFQIKLMDRMKALTWLAEHMDLATPEQRARVEKLRLEVERAKASADGEDGGEDDPLTASIREAIAHGGL